MYDWWSIYHIMENRKSKNSALLTQMIAVKDRYNGDWILPDLSHEAAAELPPLTPALLSETIDNFGMRAGSTLPAVRSPAVDSTKQTGKRSVAYARTRSKIITGTYHYSKFQLGLRKMYRHLTGYATAACVVIPDFEAGYPCIKVRDPLSSYPDPKTGEDFTPPENIGFIYGKSVDAIIRHFPSARSVIPVNARDEEIWELVEWIDAEHIVVGLLGPRYHNHMTRLEPQRYAMELKRWPNRAGRVTAICPSRVTLDRIASQLVHVTGITDVMAKMMALDIMAKEKGIFPDRFVLGRSGLTPQIIGGEWQDGRTGKMNMVLDAENIGNLPFSPDPTSTQAIDRLERNARISSGLVPQMGGETYGALRTGRGIDALMGAAVDPRIQEMQEIMEAWLPDLNESIFATYKGYWGSKQFVMISGWPLDSGELTFTPNEHIETYSNTVQYPVAGADVQSVNIILGQMLGADAISRRTFRERHPWIGDAAEESARVDEETFERAALQALLNKVMTDQMPLIALAEIEKARRADPNGDIFTAMEVADRKMKEQQATPPPPAPDGMNAPPENMPGMETGPALPQDVAGALPAGATAGAPGAPPGASIGPTENMRGLRELMNALAQTQRRVA